MITVYKYVIDPENHSVEMPADAEILTTAFHGEDFCLWAKVNTENKNEYREFCIFGTGHEIPSYSIADFSFIGTGFMNNGLVFHCFERT